MNISIKEVKTRKDRTVFIQLPAKIHKDHARWVPPIYMDDRNFFNPKKNRLFRHSDVIMLLALKNDEVVGRIMGIINHKYNSAHNLEEGRFAFIETYNDMAVALALIKFTEDWARNKGMKMMVGPLGFSDKDPQGLLIEGYDESPVIASNYNFPYMVDFVEKAGYGKKFDLLVFKVFVPEEVPEFYKRISERTLRNNPGLKIIEPKKRKELKPLIVPVLQLMNETFTKIYAFTELTKEEMLEFANRYIFILEPKFIKIIADQDGKVIAFILAIPDINDGIRKCRGRMLPFGIFRVIRSQKKTKQLNLMLGAIAEKYQNIGLDAILGGKILEEARKAGMEYLDSHLELETNTKMHAENEKAGGKVYKRFRIFEKAL